MALGNLDCNDDCCACLSVLTVSLNSPLETDEARMNRKFLLWHNNQTQYCNYNEQQTATLMSRGWKKTMKYTNTWNAQFPDNKIKPIDYGPDIEELQFLIRKQLV